EEVDQAHRTALVIDGLLRELRTFPQVESAAADSMPPYMERTWGTILDVKGRPVPVTADQATDDFAKVMRMPVLKGRWFTRDDDGRNVLPLVIDTNAAKALFGDSDPIGQTLPGARFSDTPADFKVVGVIQAYRKDGELSETTGNMIFLRTSLV